MGVNLFKIGRDLIGGAKGFGKSFVPPKKPTKPHMQNKKQAAKFEKKAEGIQDKRNEAFSRQIMAGGTLAAGTAYLMRDKPKAAAAPTAAPAARKATPVAKKPHPRLADYAIPAAPKKPGILSRVATSLKSKVSSKSISKPASKSASKPSTRKSNFRKSDNRLGGFGGAQRASARREAPKETKPAPRATIGDYTSPTPGMKAFGIDKPFAPEPKVRTEIKKSLGSNVVLPRSYRGKRLRSDANKPASEPKANPTRKGRKAKTTYTPGASTSGTTATGGKGSRGKRETPAPKANPTRKGRSRNVPGKKDPAPKRTKGRRRND
jgi:hypothetical protein